MQRWPLHRIAGMAALAAAAVLLSLAGALTFSHRASSAAAPSRQTGNTWFTGTQWMPVSKVFWATNFTLADQNRQPVSLQQFRGHVVLLSFTSSVCKQQCPLIGRTVAEVERQLGPLSAKTVLLNVSVDPEVDTPRTVSRFAGEMGWTRYHWYYLWAPRRQLQPIWKAYGIYVPTPAPIYKPGLNIIHTAATAMIDQQGRVRGFFAYPFLASYTANGVRHLLSSRT